MIEGLLCIFGSYGLGVVLVHLVHSIHRGHKDRRRIYVLVTHNNQAQIEWYIRSLSFFSWLKGREIDIHILDEGSTDDTMGIIERVARDSRAGVHMFSPGMSLDDFMRKHENDPIVLVWLSGQGEMVNLPLYE